jgi:pimeloyl-ACP methyl ester carboxylesterase
LDLDSYKKLRSKTLNSDEVLLAILDEVQQIWPGIDTDKFALMGCSGGGQLVNRFVYFHPNRLSRVCIAAPGSVTKISDEPWPRGLGDVQEIFGEIRPDIGSMGKIADILIVVGEADTDVNAQLELKHWLDKAMGTGFHHAETSTVPTQSRVETCRELHRNWSEHDIHSALTVVPGVGHSYVGLLPTMLAWLEG